MLRYPFALLSFPAATEMEADRQRGLQAEAYRDYLRTLDGRAMRHALDEQMEEKNKGFFQL